LPTFASLLAKDWPNNRTINIVCQNHSVPAGYFLTPMVDSFNAYPHLLHQQLKRRFPHAVVNVIVTAIGDENSEQGAARFATDVLTHRADLVTLDYALNDRHIGLGRARVAWSAMIEHAQGRHVPLMLLTPTADSTANLADPADPLNEHASLVRTLAAEYQVALVDSLATFSAHAQAGRPLDELLSQFNHPNRAGHELVVHEFLKWFP